MAGYIETYTIGATLKDRVTRLRLILAGVDRDLLPPHRSTQDRWKRCWQAEHTGDFDHLGATRRWTRTGAYIAHHRKVVRAGGDR